MMLNYFCSCPRLHGMGTTKFKGTYFCKPFKAFAVPSMIVKSIAHASNALEREVDLRLSLWFWRQDWCSDERTFERQQRFINNIMPISFIRTKKFVVLRGGGVLLLPWFDGSDTVDEVLEDHRVRECAHNGKGGCLGRGWFVRFSYSKPREPRKPQEPRDLEGSKGDTRKGAGENILKVKKKRKVEVFSGCFQVLSRNFRVFSSVCPYPLYGHPLWALPRDDILKTSPF